MKSSIFCSVVLLFGLLPPVVHAESFTLKCIYVEGDTAPTLTIDLEKKEITTGSRFSTYDITDVNENYISAYLRPNGVGGEVIVIDRRNGNFTRGLVINSFDADIEKPSSAKINSITFYGRCTKQLF